MILSDPDTNSFLHVHFVILIWTICYALWVSYKALLSFSSGIRVAESRDILTLSNLHHTDDNTVGIPQRDMPNSQMKKC